MLGQEGVSRRRLQFQRSVWLKSEYNWQKLNRVNLIELKLLYKEIKKLKSVEEFSATESFDR